MDLKIKRCRTCGRVGVGDNATRLYPFEGWLYCERGTPDNPGCYRQALHWHESRGNIILAIMFELAKASKKARQQHDWMPYIHELCVMASLGLEHGDQRTFVHYFARAMQAWDLKEIDHETYTSHRQERSPTRRVRPRISDRR